jgi:hypothetical protein
VFLRLRQHPDGSWEEDDAVSELAPSWTQPGMLGSRLYLTANCAWEQLVNSRGIDSFVMTDETTQRAGAYLEQYLAEDGSLPSFLQAHWLAAALWIRLGRDALATRVLDYLATRMNTDVSASSLAWMLTTLGRLGIPLEHPLGQRATALLSSLQRQDGSWPSEEASSPAPYVTVQALRGLFMWAAI